MGVFTILSDLDSDSTVISNLFIDEYMLDASDCQIKVYLYLVRMMSAGRAASISDMAEQFGHPQKEILRALKFWEKSGLLSLQCDRAGRLISIHLCEVRPRVIVRDPETDDAGRVVSIEPLLSDTQEKKPVERARLSKEAIEAFGKEEDNQALVYLAEKYIGKTLSVRELESLCYISDNLHFSFDLIDYLIQYCVSRGKRDFRYIEKVAVSWAEKGITTVKDAQQEEAAASRRKRERGITRPLGSKSDFNRFARRDDYDFDESSILDN